MSPLVSIVLTVFNINPTYLTECLSSIRAQTYKNIEIIIIDDASTKRDYSYLKDKDIKFYRNPINMGLCLSVTKAFEMVEGEYVVRLGSDDRFHPSLIAKEVEYLETHPDHIACCCDLQQFGTKTNRIVRDEEFDINSNLRAKHNVYGYGGGMMFRALALSTCTIDKKLSMCEDLDFHYQLLKLGKIHGINEPLYLYRQHETNTCKTISKYQRANYLKYIFEKHHVHDNLVSILMPTYNTDTDYVSECLKSIRLSTYKNIEIIFVNDHSRFDYRTLDEFKLLKDHIKYVVNETNLGISNSLNKACELAHGQYLLRIDSDDIVDPEFIQKEYEFLRDHKTYIGCCCDLKRFGIKDGIIKRPLEFDLESITSIETAHGCGYGCGFMFKRRALEEGCRFDPTFTVCEDFDFHIQLLKIGRIRSLPAMYNYRQHRTSTIKQYRKLERRELIESILMKHNLIKNNL